MKTKIHDFLGKNIKNYHIKDTDDFFALGLVNSLFVMQLVLFVEQEFKIEVTGDDLNFDNFRTIDAITAFVQRKTKQ